MTEKPPRAPLPPLEPTVPALVELAAAARWVDWKYEWVGEKWTKIPYQPTGQKASTTDPATWTTYRRARERAAAGAFDGVGYVVYRGPGLPPDDVVGVDLDDCIDADGNLSPEADAIVEEMASYAEQTPSGVGLRVLVRGTLPVNGAKKGGLELYQHGRYFTVTGDHLSWSPSEIRDGQPALDALFARVFGDRAERVAGPVRQTGLTDNELLDRLFAAQGGDDLRLLYDGDDGPYGSPSEGDLRLCGALAFWTGRDADRIDRLFRGSARMRPKWDERHRGDGATYGRMTVEEAVAGCDDVYEPEAPTARVKTPSSNGAAPAPEPEPEKDEPPPRPEKRPWPAPMGDAAFLGLAGETVRALEPYTEGDRHGLLVGVLTAFGCMLHAGPYLLHGSTVHWARLFALVVGGTGDGRKGESWTPVRRLVFAVDKEFRGRVQSGLSSGEGLIAAVRDPAYGVVKGEVVLVDEGVADKRLLVFEAEFARVLTVINRETNTLGAIVRDAWDTGDLAVMTKVPTRVTGAHICVVGHITPEELVANCDQSWITNGFLNRFLVVLVRRQQLLPIPRALEGTALEELARRWHDAVDTARLAGRMGWTPAGRIWWETRYASFLTTETGKLGAMKVRAAPIVLRLAMTYALMNGERELAPPALEAGEEVWRYSERSVEYLFGESTGNATADVIHRYLRQHLQMTKTEVHRLFNRHKELHEIDAALALLSVSGLAYSKYSVPKNGGRVETWYLQE